MTATEREPAAPARAATPMSPDVRLLRGLLWTQAATFGIVLAAFASLFLLYAQRHHRLVGHGPPLSPREVGPLLAAGLLTSFGVLLAIRLPYRRDLVALVAYQLVATAVTVAALALDPATTLLLHAIPVGLVWVYLYRAWRAGHFARD